MGGVLTPFRPGCGPATLPGGRFDTTRGFPLNEVLAPLWCYGALSTCPLQSGLFRPRGLVFIWSAAVPVLNEVLALGGI